MPDDWSGIIYLTTNCGFWIVWAAKPEAGLRAAVKNGLGYLNEKVKRKSKEQGRTILSPHLALGGKGVG